MTNENSNPLLTLPDKNILEKSVNRRTEGRLFGVLGIVMVLGSFCFLGYVIVNYKSFIDPNVYLTQQANANQSALFAALLLPFVIISFSVVTFFLGYRLVIASGVATDFVLPIQDKDLLADMVKDGNELGVRLYMDLTNVKGTTGTFTKLGITGLPLATIFLTCFFALWGGWNGNTTILDMSKLTLGAFIGSFVQRQNDRERRLRMDSSQSHDVATPKIPNNGPTRGF